jgi:ribosomal-protein-alanine N-acetyltransferase
MALHVPDRDVTGAPSLPALHRPRVTQRPAVEAGGDSADWRTSLPTIAGDGLTLRELRLADAPSLCALLAPEEVSRFLSPPPATVDGFERFIVWTHRKRAEGSCACFAVVPRGLDVAVGFFQVRALDESFTIAEWGFALGRPFWGTGLFVEGATRTLDFVFGRLGVQRLEARAAARNGRGNGALRKMGAVCEAVLRRAFRKDGESMDQLLWSLLAADWWRARVTSWRSHGGVH